MKLSRFAEVQIIRPLKKEEAGLRVNPDVFNGDYRTS